MEDKIEFVETGWSKTSSTDRLLPLLKAAHAELPDFNEQSLPSFLQMVADQLSGFDSVMYCALRGQELIGVCSVLVEDDIHVGGSCCTVHWQYILPEYRGAVGVRFMRWAFSVAKRLRIPYLAYSHRAGKWKHVVTYRKVTHDKSCTNI